MPRFRSRWRVLLTTAVRRLFWRLALVVRPPTRQALHRHALAEANRSARLRRSR